MKQLHFSIMLFVLLSMFSVQSYAYNIVVKNDDGAIIYYKWINDKTELAVCNRESYNDSKTYKGDLVIPISVIYEGKKYPVTAIDKMAFSGCHITSIIIPNSVTSIGDEAFGACQDLTSISIPNGVTSIASRTFDHCIKLTSITIPNSIVSIGECAFYNCI